MRRLPLALLLAAAPAIAQVQTSGKGGKGPRGPVPSLEAAYHVLDRLSYGHTAADVERLRAIGVEAFVREQLDPASIGEDPLLLARLAQLPPRTTPVGDSTWVWWDLFADHLLRARYSRRQLNELMTEFWSNHFNTSLDWARAGMTGWFSSLAIDAAGDAHICGHDATNTTLHCYLPFSGSPGAVLPDPARPVGWFSSLRLSPADGRPVVAYHEPPWNSTGGNLRVARFDGAAWKVDVVDDAGEVGAWASLRLDGAGRARVAYHDATGGGVKLATETAAGWTLQTVDTGGVGWFASLVLRANGDPIVAYLDAAQERIRVAAYSAGSWSYTTVAPVALAGFDLAASPAPPRLLTLELDPASSQPAVAFHDPAARDLRLARFDGSSWTVETVDAPGDVGLHPSLAFDPTNGRPAIAYFDRDNFDLRYARRMPTGWLVETVVADRNIAGEWASLAFDVSGRPSISYYNGSTFSLDLMRWDGLRWNFSSVEALSRWQYIHTGWERLETEAFRAGALGRFRDLLEVSATSPAMMLYLNNNLNVAGLGNENYARELLELHTVGVDGGYYQWDVENAARALTGWGASFTSTRCDVAIGDFCYNHAAHDGRARTILGMSFADDQADLPGNWRKQGSELLDRLACHPSTARFVCKKLIEKFVSDDIPPGLWSDCAATWLHGDGNIKEVLRTILLSPDFVDPANHQNKIRTPIEFALAPLRHLEGDSYGDDLFDTISLQGAELWRVPPPTGYEESGAYWVNSNTMVQRWKHAERLLHATRGSTVDPAALAARAGLDRADPVIEFFLDLLVRGVVDPLERAELLGCLNAGDPGPIDLADPAVAGRLRDTVQMILSFPEYQKQ